MLHLEIGAMKALFTGDWQYLKGDKGAIFSLD
jgi:hypothetical protein